MLPGRNPRTRRHTMPSVDGPRRGTSWPKAIPPRFQPPRPRDGSPGIGLRIRPAWLAPLVAAAALILAACAGSPPAQSTPTAAPPTGSLLVGPNIDVSQAPGSQDEVSAALDPADPNVLLAGSNSLQRDPSVRVYGSGDAGGHWTSDTLPLPTAIQSQGAVDQWVVIGPDHKQAMSYLAFGQAPGSGGLGGLTTYVATRSGPTAAWQAPSAPVDGLPGQGNYDDKPALLVDNGAASPYRGRLYVAWTRWINQQDGWLYVSASPNWGRTWSPAVALRHQGDDWGAAVAVATDGTLYVAWVGHEHLWIASSHDGGAHFSALVAFGACLAPMQGCAGGANIPAQSDAGVRANPVLVVIPAANGKPAQAQAIYMTGNGAHTQIDLAAFDAATLHALGSPTVIPIGPAGDDQFLPAAAYDLSAHALWVCAYVSPASAPTTARYTCAVSLDAGHTFLPPTPVASVASDEERPGAFRHFIGRQYGDYTALVAAGGVAHAFWTDSRDLSTLGEEIYTATLRVNPTAAPAR